MRIEEEYIKTGYFWLPEKPEKKIPGILTIKDGGEIELEVVGLFDKSIEALNGEEDFSRIIGHIEKDGLVTLDNCFYTKKNRSFGGISKSKLIINQVLSGAAYNKDAKITFNTLSFSVECMDEWVGISGIEVDTDFENGTATINYNPPKPYSYALENGMNLEINYAYTLPGFPNLKEAKITQRVYFKLKSEKLRLLLDFQEVASKITHLLCLAIDDTVSIKNLYATSCEIQRRMRDGETYPVPIYIYYRSLAFSEKVPKRNWHQMLFTFKMIKQNAQDIINNWIAAYETLSPALDLYFSTRMGAQKYLEGKFLALAQGLETYHRRTSNEKLMDDSQFNSLVSTIMKSCPNDQVEWLESRLIYGNEINLRKRLKRIIEPFKDHIGNSKERSKLLTKIVDTRNYLTHYSVELQEKTANGQDLWVLCQKMEAIFQLHFLKVIGFTDEEIVTVIKNCRSLKTKLNKI